MVVYNTQASPLPPLSAHAREVFTLLFLIICCACENRCDSCDWNEWSNIILVLVRCSNHHAWVHGTAEYKYYPARQQLAFFMRKLIQAKY